MARATMSRIRELCIKLAGSPHYSTLKSAIESNNPAQARECIGALVQRLERSMLKTVGARCGVYCLRAPDPEVASPSVRREVKAFVNCADRNVAKYLPALYSFYQPLSELQKKQESFTGYQRASPGS